MSAPVSRQEFERRLLAAPFDLDLRAAYAVALLDAGEVDAAYEQAMLVVHQSGDHALGQVVLARVQYERGRTAEALAMYERARALETFTPDAVLEGLRGAAQPSRPMPLHSVPSGGGAKVVSFHQVSDEKVRFSSIVGMDELKKTIRLKIIDPYLNPGLFARFKSTAGGGLLLFGPPGCGKTMIARAVANECGATFESIGISDVLNMWLGESERNLAAVFDKARSQQPCVLFFDELDALAYSRAKAGSSSARTVVNEFLSQLDGVGRDNRGLLILAATNMPWDVDSAMRRPGRFSRQIFVPPPDVAARRAMLETKLLGIPQKGLDLAVLAQSTAHFSGADIDGLIEMAKESALSEALSGVQDRQLLQSDFEFALRQMQPSTLDWLRTVRNVVKYAGDDATYRDVERYLKATRLM